MPRYEMFLERLGQIEWKFNVAAGMAVVILLFVLELIWLRKYRPRNKRVEQAEALGHVVRAKRIQAWDDDLTRTSTSSYVHATYLYEVDGKEYRYNYLKRAAAPLTLTLYYIHNPKRAFMKEEKTSLFLGLLLYLVPIAAGVGVMLFLG